MAGEGDAASLAGAGQEDRVRMATYFGTIGYQIVSDADHGKITATVEMPARRAPKSVLLRLRHPQALRMKSVTVNGNAWKEFDPAREVISLHDIQGIVTVESNY